jgi:molybdopterin-containing oxidoreductase family iron-sulfur binding subunit
LHDGRAGDSSWLHEVPDPLTRVAWGSWVELSPSDARAHGIGARDRVRVSTAAGSVVAPAFVWEGVAPGVVAVHLGRDREPAGGPGRGDGRNAFSLLVPGEPFPPVEIARLGAGSGLAIGQPSSNQRGMRVARTWPAERDGASAAVDLACLADGPQRPGPDGAHPRWALSVDLSKCTGCAACVVACYAENNIPAVGPEEVARSRDMAWLRVDRYLDWSCREAPVLFMPVMCQHCDAPSCAAACPVSAPRRTADGLTLQAYGRCIGARRCAGHCPYRVLRFNWSDPGADGRAGTSLNPEVPPRGRGIVEKCTFCAQRIREGQRRAEAEGRALADGEVQPACVQTCPTGALAFGDARRPDSQVGRTARHNARAYQALDARGTRPGVVYLSRVAEG